MIWVGLFHCLFLLSLLFSSLFPFLFSFLLLWVYVLSFPRCLYVCILIPHDQLLRMVASNATGFEQKKGEQLESIPTRQFTFHSGLQRPVRRGGRMAPRCIPNTFVYRSRHSIKFRDPISTANPTRGTLGGVATFHKHQSQTNECFALTCGPPLPIAPFTGNTNPSPIKERDVIEKKKPPWSSWIAFDAKMERDECRITESQKRGPSWMDIQRSIRGSLCVCQWGCRYPADHESSQRVSESLMK